MGDNLHMHDLKHSQMGERRESGDRRQSDKVVIKERRQGERRQGAGKEGEPQ